MAAGTPVYADVGKIMSVEVTSPDVGITCIRGCADCGDLYSDIDSTECDCGTMTPLL